MVTRTILLSLGLVAPLLQFATDRVAGTLLANYSFSAQSMTELSAAGSPVRSLTLPLTVVAAALMTAFGVGVWHAGDRAILPRIVAILLISNTALGLVATLFFPPQFGERPAFGSVGVILMFLSVVCFVLAMIVGAAAFSGWLRIVSIGIPVGYILLAVVRLATANADSTLGAASMIGTQERTMAYSFLFWAMALAVYLLTSSGSAESAS
jgi:hypothetical protein